MSARGVPWLRRALARGRARDESGFTIVESMVAIGIVFSVLLALLGTMNAGVRGIVLGRQRNGATALADDILEQARGRAYAEVGHDLDDDSTLATDPSITGVLPNFTYNGEQLAPSSINSASNAPFTPHKWTATKDGTPYTVYVYITQIIPAAGNGDPYKRMTVKVTWGKTQYASNVAASQLVQSTFLYPAAKPPNPWLDGVVDADAGSLTVTGTLDNVDLKEGDVWFPYSQAEVHSRDIQVAKGYSGTARSQFNVNSGSVTGCSLSNGNLTADCPGQKAVSFADNDEGTTPPENDSQSVTDTGHTVSGGSPLSLTFGGSNSSLSQSQARSQSASSCSGVLGNDLLPFQCSNASGPASLTNPFSVGPVSGSLLSSSASASAKATVDRTDVPSASRLAALSTTTTAAMDVLTLSGAPSGYNGVVRVPATSVTATANSGAGVSAPSVTGSAFTVQIYDTTGTPGYKNVTVTPGNASTNTGTAVLSIGGSTVNMTTTVVTTPKVVSSTADSTGAITHAEASMASWLDITVHLTVVTGGSTHADFTVDVDYGRVSCQADYQLN